MLNPDSQAKFDTTMAVITDSFTLHGRASSGRAMNMSAYFRSMTGAVWFWGLCLGVLLPFGLFLCTYFLENTSDQNVAGLLFSAGGKFAQTAFFRGDFYAGGQAFATKIVMVACTFHAFWTYLPYAATLTSVMISIAKQDDITSMKDAINKGYNIIVRQNTVSHHLLVHAEPGSANFDIFHEKIKNNPMSLTKSFREGPVSFRRENSLVCSGK